MIDPPLSDDFGTSLRCESCGGKRNTVLVICDCYAGNVKLVFFKKVVNALEEKRFAI
jgi:hypothetical protein